MRSLIRAAPRRAERLLPGLAISLGVLGAVGPMGALGCKVEHEAGLPADAPDDGTADASDSAPYDNDASAPDAAGPVCTLPNPTAGFNASDPVAFCTQKAVLAATHLGAFSAAKGLAQSWSAKSGIPDTSDAGAVLHDWHDDVGYAAACALYHSSAIVYGDMQLTPTLDADLVALAPLLEKELSPLPAEYTGETYQRLRVAGLGLNVANDTTDSQTLLAIADKYAEAIYTRYFVHLSPLPVAPVDGGAGQSEAGPSSLPEAGVSDGAAAGGGGPAPIANGIFGVARSGAYAYVTADVATAAYALLDLASRYPNNAENTNWQKAAESALDHLYQRARDPMTGLYYTALVTSDEGTHDTVDPAVAGDDVLLTDTTVTVALAIARAQATVASTPALTIVANYPFSDQVGAALAAINGKPSLYDNAEADAGTSTGFFEGYNPSTQALVQSKATRANAYALAVLHRQVVGAGTMYGSEIPPLFETLIKAIPQSSSLYSVVPGQTAFLRASSRSFEVLPSSVAEAFPDSYQTKAVVAAIEGLNDQLFGTSL